MSLKHQHVEDAWKGRWLCFGYGLVVDRLLGFRLPVCNHELRTKCLDFISMHWDSAGQGGILGMTAKLVEGRADCRVRS